MAFVQNVLSRSLTRVACVAAVALLSSMPAVGGVSVEPNELLEFEYQQSGNSEEEAVRLACIRAVKATVVRAVHSDYTLQAQDRLDVYLQQNWTKFTASNYVLERRVARDGFAAKVRVITRPRALFNDLRELKFLTLPSKTPTHFVFLAESVDAADGSGKGRDSLNKSLVTQGLKVVESGIVSPAPGSDVLDPNAFAAAREAATRIGADMIITGRATTRQVAKGAVLYDELITYETQMTVSLIRVADGTTLGKRTVSERSTFKSPDTAREDSIRGAAKAAAEALAGLGRDIHARIALDHADFSLLLTDVTPQELESVARHIETSLNRGTLTYIKLWYGNAAVLNVATPASYAELERVLQNFKAPMLRITERRNNRITVTCQQ